MLDRNGKKTCYNNSLKIFDCQNDGVCDYCYTFSDKPYVCFACFRSYSWKRGLVQHQKYSCGKEPQFPCPVEGCYYRANIRGNVKQHYNIVHIQKRQRK